MKFSGKMNCFKISQINLFSKFMLFCIKDFVQPICVPSDEGLVVNERTIFTAAGWGKTETGLLQMENRRKNSPTI